MYVGDLCSGLIQQYFSHVDLSPKKVMNRKNEGELQKLVKGSSAYYIIQTI